MPAAATTRGDQALFAIVQGGLDPQLRVDCARRLAELDFPGYAVGGLSVGEEPAQMYQVLDATVPALPAERPRYLMGVGRPQDLLEAIRRGIDLFDCVMPTRNGRNALAFTDAGPIRLRNLQYERDLKPLEPDCPCPACRHSRGYLRHLFMAGEMLGPMLVSAHNLTYYQRLLGARGSPGGAFGGGRGEARGGEGVAYNFKIRRVALRRTARRSTRVGPGWGSGERAREIFAGLNRRFLSAVAQHRCSFGRRLLDQRIKERHRQRREPYGNPWTRFRRKLCLQWSVRLAKSPAVANPADAGPNGPDRGVKTVCFCPRSWALSSCISS